MVTRLVGVVLLVGAVTLLACVPAAVASFGFGSVDMTFTDEGGAPAVQAGSHPFAQTVSLSFDTTFDQEAGFEVPDQSPRDVTVGLPTGLVGDPSVVPACSGAEFANEACRAISQVGVNEVTAFEPGKTDVVPVYRLAAPPGVVMKLGFHVTKVPVTVDLGVSPNAPYNVIATLRYIPNAVPVYASALTVWGVPASPSHGTGREGLQEKPFLTLPTSCAGPLSTGFEADSWDNPGVWVKTGSETHDNGEPPQPLGMTGCQQLHFDPTVSATPTSVAASSPTGLEFHLDVADEGLTSPSGLAESDIKKVLVTLPEAVSVNPALAEGLSGCSEADLARETATSAPGDGCPQASKIGTVEVETPLLEETLKGSLFIATPYQNPFDSLIGLYVVVANPQTGIILKIPGKVQPDGATGQLVSIFDDLPQLPFSHLRLSFRQGERSPLVTPDACGTYTTQAELTPWADPEKLLRETSSFQVVSGIGGTACPSGGAGFKPVLIAGSENNTAAGYSPLYLRIERKDDEQEITGFSSLLPSGLTADLTGVPFCSETQIAQAEQRSGKENGGAEEQANPSCPLASQIGHTLVGVGVGSILAYDPGKLYMAGPYQGAPFSVVAITSAKVGPFDLGTVIVHLPLNIDPVTAQVSIPAGAADQIPHIIKGIVVHVRDIRVYVNRPNFTLNPTNCSPLTFGASVIGSGQNFVSPTDDVASNVNDPFQTANCANLAFKPSFKVSTSGKTSRKNGASLSVKLAYPKAPLGTQANIRSVKVSLPKQLPSRLTTLQQACTDAQFTANPAGCPAASRVGQASAITPILPVPITGPAYFVSHGGAKFPELILVLQGYGVTIDLHGETFISKAGITSSTFHTVPDQPVTSFELTLPQGPNSALSAPGNLCAVTKTVTVKKKVTVRSKGHARTITRRVKQAVPAPLVMPTSFTGQNGAVVKQNTQIEVTGCARHKAKNARKARRAAHHH